MVEYLTREKITEFSRLFAYCDYHSSGTITIESLHSILKSMSLRVSLEQVKSLLRETAPENSTCDTVTLTQFLAIISIIIEDKDMNRQVYDLFELFDLDKNKVIDREDFNVGMKTLESGIDDEQILKMIEFVGQDSLTLRDFRKCVMER